MEKTRKFLIHHGNFKKWRNVKTYVRFKTCTCNGSRTVSIASVPKKLRERRLKNRCLRTSKSSIIDASQ